MNTIEHIDPLLKLIADEEITEIIINNEEDIYFEKKGQFFCHTENFGSSQNYKLFIQRFCQKAKIQFDLNQPFADGYLAPFRIHLVSPPLSQSVQLTLRRLRQTPWDLAILQKQNWATTEQIEKLKGIVENHHNILIIGSTGTGKTSCLNALINILPDKERVIIIEDTNELKLPNKISTKLLTRQDIHGHLKSYTQEDLIKQALRMRPHRLVIGEIRGREAKDLLLALSTGHAGSMGSLHAEDAHQALLRLEMLIKMGAPEWDTLTVRNLIYFSLHYIVTLKTSKSGERKLYGLHKIAGLESHGFTLSKIF
ncbi:MAG: CpaF family protein [Bdellovibrionales bacterium]|nr:CpaF family protein [Bdellovibrionales bacterium]